MKYIILSATLFLFLNCFGQNCSQEILAKKPGIWKAGTQGSIKNITTTDLVKEKQVLAAIHKMITTSYTPMGCQVSYSNVFGKYPDEGQTFMADPYHYAMYILRYLCDGNSTDKSKFYTDVSTPTTINVTVNEIFSLNNLYAANIPTGDSRGYLKLKQKPQKKEGVWFMGEEVVGDYGTASEIKEYRWLITYNDTLPFYYVSRKEYLMIQKKRLEKYLKDSPSEKEYMSQYVDKINAFLKKSEVELSIPAICMWNDEERFEKFVEEGTPGSFIAVKPNLNYYHKKLPVSSPQFFTVVYKISKGDPVFVDNYEALKKAIDFTKLKTMLGK